MSKLKKECIRRWSGDYGADRVYPTDAGIWPDADSISMLQRLCTGRVVEVGCGTGRCAEAFDAEAYVGVDINPVAVARATAKFPMHDFRTIGWSEQYPRGDTYLFYTVMLHVPDDELESMLARTQAYGRARVVIFESMMPEFRNPETGNFTRSPDGYGLWVRGAGLVRDQLHALPSKRHPFLRHFMVAK